jgi:X8 domain
LSIAKGAKAEYKPNQWCVADNQLTDDILQEALDWACGPGHANCTAIQPKMACYLPNTVKDHASFAFNSYWQKFKKQGATCNFHAAAMVTDVDPSKSLSLGYQLIFTVPKIQKW